MINFAQSGLETNTHWWIHASVYFVMVNIPHSTARPRPGNLIFRDILLNSIVYLCTKLPVRYPGGAMVAYV
jgi:hypothetical protein